ncbi:hypothetical protein SGLAM104S_05433 [Streptomyces glaucescens]
MGCHTAESVSFLVMPLTTESCSSSSGKPYENWRVLFSSPVNDSTFSVSELMFRPR